MPESAPTTAELLAQLDIQFDDEVEVPNLKNVTPLEIGPNVAGPLGRNITDTRFAAVEQANARKRTSDDSMTESDIEEEIQLRELRQRLKKRQARKSREPSVANRGENLGNEEGGRTNPRGRRETSHNHPTPTPTRLRRGGQHFAGSSSESDGANRRSRHRTSQTPSSTVSSRDFPIREGKSYKVAEASLFKKFSGEKDALSIDQWIRSVELVLRQINGDQRDILYNLPRLLVGGARKWFEALDDDDQDELQSWPAMREALLEAFRSETHEVDMFNKMVTRVLQFDESPIEYFHDKKALCKLADPDCSETAIGKHILQGLPTRFTAMLDWKPSQNLKILFKQIDRRKALLFSNHWCDADGNPFKPTKKKKQNALSPDPKKADEEAKPVSAKGDSPKKVPKTPCKCGGWHFYRECPNGLKPPADGVKKSPSVGVNLIELDEDNDKMGYNSDSSVEQVSQDEAELMSVIPVLSNEADSNPLLFDAFKEANERLWQKEDLEAVNKDAFASRKVTTPAVMMVKSGASGQEHRAIMDSGAAMSVMSPEYHRKHFDQHCVLRSPAITLSGVGKSTAEGFVSIPIRPQGGKAEKSFSARFYLCEKIPDGLVIGVDVMEALGMILDLKSREVTIQGHPSPYPITLNWPLRDAPDPLSADHQFDLRTVEDLTLEPRSRTMVVVQTGPGGRTDDFLCCPITINQGVNAVRGAWTIAPRYQEQVVTELANLECDPVTIREGTVVSHAHPIELDEEVLECVAEATANGPKVYETFDDMVKAMHLNNNLTPEQREKVVEILRKHDKVFSNGTVGLSNRGPFHIETGDAKPVSSRPYKASPLTRKHIDAMVDDMTSRGMWRRTDSAWASPVVPVPQGNKIRICIDYRKVNAVTVNSMSPLPPIGEALHELNNCSWFSSFDANRGYHQIPVTKETGEKLAVTTHRGLFAPNRLMFGPKGAPGFFQALMDDILKDGAYKWCFAYVDDIVVYSKTFDEHLADVDWVLHQFEEAGLTLGPEKSFLFQDQIDTLGHRVSELGIRIGNKNREAIINQPTPTNLGHLEHFIGLSGFYKQYIPAYRDVMAPVFAVKKEAYMAMWKRNKGRVKAKNAMAQKMNPNQPIEWTLDADNSFRAIKDFIVGDPMLAHPDVNELFLCKTDASSSGFGAVLSQMKDGKERPIAFLSRATTKEESHLGATDLELEAICWALKKFTPYVEGCKIQVFTDHQPLTNMPRYSGDNHKLRRRAVMLQAFGDNLTITYKPGPKQKHVDFLSRHPVGPTDFSFVTRKFEPERPPAPEELIAFEKPPATEVMMAWHILNTDQTMEEEVVSKVKDDPDLQKIIDEINVAWEEQQAREEAAREKAAKEREARRRARARRKERDPDASDCDSTDDEEDTATKKPALPPVKKHPTRPFSIRNGKLYRWDAYQSVHALCVPNVDDLRTRVIEIYHDAPSSAHRGERRTYTALASSYYWRRMRKDVEAHVRSCDRCQRSRTSTQLPVGHLQPTEIPGGRWKEIFMDFAVGLPEIEGKNAVLVVGDMFSRRTRYIPVHDEMDATDIARTFYDEVIKHHGVPDRIISDKDPKFLSAFWQSLSKLMKIRLSMAAAHHAEADGASERMVKQLKEGLKLLVNPGQTDWLKKLTPLEIAYNCSIHSSTLKTPYELDLGRIPRFFEITDPKERASDPELKSFLDKLEADGIEAMQALQDAKAVQARYYNDRHRQVDFWEGDEVLLSSAAYDPTFCKVKPAPKIAPPWFGPFKVVKVHGPTTISLEFPDTWKVSNPVNTKNVRKYIRRDGHPQSISNVARVIGFKVSGPTILYPDGKPMWLAIRDGQYEHLGKWLDREEMVHYGAGGIIDEYDQLITPEALRETSLAQAAAARRRNKKTKK